MEAYRAQQPCVECGDTEETVYFERDEAWACADPSLCIERQRDQAREQLRGAVEALREVVRLGGTPRDSMLSDAQQYRERGQAMMDAANAALDRIGGRYDDSRTPPRKDA